MRFLDLRLIAYGPFTDHVLDLAGGKQGLHIVYGPNEAGKSASLRAISALLYGIPASCPDAFVHGYKDLRVGGNLRHSSGDEDVFIRRKGRKNTLLDEKENPFADDALNRFLGVVDVNLFEHLYGFNHQTLLNGGLEMKNLKGHIGATLFSAGLGSGVNDLFNRLLEEEKALAAPRSVQGITRQLAAYKEIKKEVGSLALASGQWQEADSACSRLQKEIAELNDTVLIQAQERSALERQLRNLPRLARLKKLEADLADQEPITTLPATYSPEARQKAVYALEQAVAGQKRLDEQLATVLTQIEEIALPSLLLEHGEKIRQLYRKLDTHQTAAADRQALVAKRIQKENDVKQALLDLAPDLPFAEVEKLRLSRGELERLRELCVEYNLMHERPQIARHELEQICHEISTLKSELKEIPEITEPLPLKKALTSLSRQGNLEQYLTDAETRQRESGEEARRGLAKLGYSEHDDQTLASFLDTAFPSLETVDQFDPRFRKLEQDETLLTQRITETTTDLERLETEIESLRKTGHLFTEADLLRLRAARDESWQSVKQSWLNGQQDDHDPQILASSYEAEVTVADEAADRLRREAAQVQQLARFEAERDVAAKRLNLLKEEKEQLAKSIAQLKEEWRKIWLVCPFVVGSPAEMRGWLSRCDQVVNLAGKYFEASRQVKEISEAIAIACKQLVAVLAPFGDCDAKGESLGGLLLLGEERLEKTNKLAVDRERLARALADRKGQSAAKEEQLSKEEERLSNWQKGWHQAIEKLPLAPQDASPGQVSTVIDMIDNLFDNVGEINGFDIRIKAIDKNRREFAQEVDSVVKNVAPTLVDKKDEEAITLLAQQFEKAGNDSVKLDGLHRRRQDINEEAAHFAETIDKAKTYLASLCKEIGCENHADLPEIEKRWAKCMHLAEEKKRCEDDIINDGGGSTLAEITTEVAELDGDHLTARIGAFADKLQELNHQKDEKSRELYALEAAKRQMDGNDRAAEAAEQATLAGAEVGKSVHRYIRVKLAGALLRRRIEEHRRKSQSPVLALANDFFRQITLGEFHELTTTFDNDQQILIGVRDNGNKVKIEEMSEGTRDQLYLSLRLAYLDHELSEGSREPMPFVLDDILMNFDDARAQAALRILAELSKKTQIIYFTHHQHLRELAEQAGDADTVQIHSLAG